MRILFLNHRFSEIGGLAEFLHFLPMELKKLGAQTFLYTPAENKIKELAGPIQLTNGLQQYTGGFPKPRFFIPKNELRSLQELCIREKIDIIHAQGIYRCGYVARQIYKTLSIPYVITSHSDILTSNSKRMGRGKIKRRCKKILQDTAYITHLTPIMEKAAYEICNVSGKERIIHNGIDTIGLQKFSGLPEQDFMLAIGRLVPEKGFDILLNAYAELIQQGVTTSLVIAGIGSAEQALQQQTRELKLNVITNLTELTSIPTRSVIFTGYVQGDTKLKLFAQCKFILFATQPSLCEESFGIVQLEALAAGKTMLASDMAATRYLQQLGMKTLLVEPTDIKAWAAQMLYLLGNSGLRNKLGQINLEIAKRFNWDLIAKQYYDVYLAVLAKSGLYMSI